MAVPVFWVSSAKAERFTSPNYTIDASAVGNSFGGTQASGSYSLVSSGGESVIGNATGGSYKLGEGYVAQLEQSLQLTLSTTNHAIGTVTPGVSKTFDFSAAVVTDAPGYTLSVSQDSNLTNGANTIPGVSGTIAAPVTWSEGATKGLGFTLVSGNPNQVPAKWNAGASYASFPATDTAFYSRTGLSGGSTDDLNLRLRLDVGSTQPTGVYSNVTTWTGTMTP